MSDTDEIRDLINELVVAGATPTQMAIVSSIVAVCLTRVNKQPQTSRLTYDEERAECKRERDRERVARRRATSRDSSVKERSPIPPKENKPPCLPSVNMPPKLNREVGTRLPENWSPPENLLAKAKAEFGVSDSELRFETESFRDHFLSVPGAKGRKIYWDRTWMNWMRNCKRWAKKSAKSDNVTRFVPQPPKRTYREIKAEQEAAKNAR